MDYLDGCPKWPNDPQDYVDKTQLIVEARRMALFFQGLSDVRTKKKEATKLLLDYSSISK